MINFEEFLSDISLKIEKKEISYTVDGVDKKQFVFVKELSYDDSLKINKESLEFEIDEKDISKSKLKEIRYNILQVLRVFYTICKDEKGTLLFKDPSAVSNLPIEVGFELSRVSDEVNDYSGKLIAKTKTNSNSGQSLSSTESEAEQSPKPKKTSRSRKSESGADTGKKEAVSTSGEE